jgi:hypothetical protein
MKTSLATAVSVVGVLLSGTAAYSMNTTILSRTSAEAASAAALAPASTTSTEATTTSEVLDGGRVEEASTGSSIGGATTPQVSATPFDSTPEVAAQTPPAVLSSAPSTTAPGATYDLGKLGNVSLRSSNGFVEVLSISSTWTVERIHGNGRLSLVFTKASERYVLDVTADGSTLQTTLTNQTPPPVTTTAPRHETKERHEEDDEDEGHEDDESERDD